MLPTAAGIAWDTDNTTGYDPTSIDRWFDPGTGETDSLHSGNNLTLNNIRIWSNPDVPYGQAWIITGDSSIVVDPKELKLMEFNRRRQALLPSAKATRFGMPRTDNFAELRARQLLKSFIGGARFKRYLKDGFISITSPVTGLVYQIFPGHRSVVVRDKGKRTASCCIVFKDHRLPPTDWVVMRMSLIVADETLFYEKANVSGSIPERIKRVA